GGPREFDRVTASRTDRAGPYPHRVELWIDPATHRPERVEFRWDAPAAGEDQGSPRDDHGPPGKDGERRGPGHDDGPGGPPPRDGHGDGPGQGPPRDGDGADHAPPGRPGRLKLIAFQRVDAPAL